MELSEEISDQTNPSDNHQTNVEQSYHRPPPSSNGDPDPATSDLVLPAGDADGGISEEIASLDVKEVEEETPRPEQPEAIAERDEERETAEKDLKETKEEEETRKSESEEKGEEEDRKSESKEKDGEGEGAIEKDLSGAEIGDRGESDNENGDGNDHEWEEKRNEFEDEIEVNNGGDEPEKKDERVGARRYQYPVRPEAEDCSFYLKTGTCKFGSNCKFNHPVRKKTIHHQASKERTKEKEESSEKPGQSECKIPQYYLRSGGCKFGKACKYNHTRGRTTPALVPVVEFNFVGLPIRVGEKECPYYMRTGSCKYGVHCRFNHPDPTDAAGSDNSTGFGNGGPMPLQGGAQSTMASWSSPRSLNETGPPAPYVPMMVPPTPVVPSPNTEWNGYQAPVYLPPDRNMPPPPPYGMNNPITETNMYKHHPPQNQAEEYPERPGQPECSYFLKTGDCKFKSNCKYHHPKNRASMKPPCALSDKGLPLRPDQNICTHFSRYGICKYGPACKYDHSPANTGSGILGFGVDNQLPYTHPATMEGAGMTRSGSRGEVSIQQSV